MDCLDHFHAAVIDGVAAIFFPIEVVGVPGAVVYGVNSGVFGGFVPFAADEFAGKILRAFGVINFPNQRFGSGGGGCAGNGAKAQRFEGLLRLASSAAEVAGNAKGF